MRRGSSLDDEDMRFGLLVARASAALERLRDRRKLTASDLAALRDLEQAFRESAEALRFAETSGRSGAPGRVAPVEFTLDALDRERAPTDTPAAAVEALADAVGAIAESSDAEQAEALVPVLHAISRLALQAAGTPGDSLLAT